MSGTGGEGSVYSREPCGGLNEKWPSRWLMCLDTDPWLVALFGVLECIGSAAWLEEEHRWRRGLRVCSLARLPVHCH